MTAIPLHYTGRFAPSPSGELHFGSLVTALASYLDARANHGKWLVRIEDIDQPRCIAHMDRMILSTLEQHGLLWDDEVLYQSKAIPRYRNVVQHWLNHQQAYYCGCSRKRIQAIGGRYDARCANASLGEKDTSVRVKLAPPFPEFNDLFLGKQVLPENAIEDIIVRRRDGFYAYNLVVVLDDIMQGVTHIVRGADLLSTTFTQQALYQLLGEIPPEYGHVPVAATQPGLKLSKQNKARPIDNQSVTDNLARALSFLGQSLHSDWRDMTPTQLLVQATTQWQREKVPKRPEIIVDKSECTYH